MSSVSTSPAVFVTRPGLVVIDAQKIFFDPASPARVDSAEAVTDNIIRLVGRFRSMDLPVLFTRHVEPASGPRGTNPAFFPRPLLEADPMSAMLPSLANLAEPGKIFTKDRHDAFSRTFPDSLGGAGILFLAGARTALCVMSTALGLPRHGIVPVVISDACADRHPTTHEAALRCLAAGHAHVKTTTETLAIIAASRETTDED